MNDSGKPRVLHVLKSSIYSGAENVAITIIKNLQNDYESAYVATDGEIRVMLEELGIKYFLLSKYSRFGIQKIVEKFYPDIIHAHDFMATVICSGIKGNFRLISHLHYDPPWTRRWNLKTTMYTICAARVSHILAVSEKSFSKMIFSARLQTKYTAVGNPIDLDKIRIMGNSNKNFEKWDLLFVGRLVEQKNPQRFLNIIKKLRDDGIDVKCAMLGNGELYSLCEELIIRYSLQKQVQLLGYQENPYLYMKEAKLLCMTSRWEGYGLVAIESNVLGIPVLSTRTSGTEEIFGSQAEELSDTDDDFVVKIKMLLSNECEYERWRKRAKNRVLHIPSMVEYMDRIKQIYQEVLQGVEN